MNTTGLIVGIIVVILVLGGGWYAMQDRSSPAPLPDNALPAPESLVDTADLTAVAPYAGSGLATRTFDGATFTHTVQAAIAAPADGKFYEGWLVMPTASGPQFFSTGELIPGGLGYTLTYTDSQDYPDHTNVVITEETSAQGLDNNPEAHVLEGSF